MSLSLPTRIRNRMLPSPKSSERGAALILALSFLIVVAAITGSLLPAISSGFKGRTILDTVRNRQYAADAGVEAAIAQTRSRFEGGNAQAPCLTLNQAAFNGAAIRVDCTFTPGVTNLGLGQRNAIYSACVDTGVACTNATTVVRAQVNFQSSAGFTAATAPITRTWIQSWSVNQ